MIDINRGLLLWFTIFFENNEHPLDLAEQLHKPIIIKLKKKNFIQDLKTISRVLI